MTTTFMSTELCAAPWSLGERYSYDLDSDEPAIRLLRKYSASTGLPFICVDAASGTVLAKTDPDFVEILPNLIVTQLSYVTEPRVWELASGLVFYAVPLPNLDDLQTIGCGYVLNHRGRITDELQRLAEELNWAPHELSDWCTQQRSCSPDLLERLLCNLFESDLRETKLRSELDELNSRGEHVQSQMRFVDSLASGLVLSTNPTELAQSCVEGLQRQVGAEACVLAVSDWHGQWQEYSFGRLPFGTKKFELLLDYFDGTTAFDSIIRNDVAGALIADEFPALRNFLLHPITDGNRHTGWVFLGNLPEGRDFGTAEARITSTVAALLATHYCNRQLYEEQEEFVLQFVGSMVSTLDAKDRYTRGHSERVAAIARQLGEEMRLSPQDLKDIHTAGLLHDIGKIGINDAILQKSGALDKTEFEEVKQHPLIGYRILRGLKLFHKLLPGVRNHHEEYSGNGYPDRLRGREIPLLARILAVADAYDAMQSDRPYRKGMPLAKVENIFREGAGTQWDPDVIAAYFAARDDIAQIGNKSAWSM